MISTWVIVSANKSVISWLSTTQWFTLTKIFLFTSKGNFRLNLRQHNTYFLDGLRAYVKITYWTDNIQAWIHHHHYHNGLFQNAHTSHYLKIFDWEAENCHNTGQSLVMHWLGHYKWSMYPHWNEYFVSSGIFGQCIKTNDKGL